MDNEARRAQPDDSGAHNLLGGEKHFFENYDNLTVGEILTVAARGNDGFRQRILAHERAHKNRDPIIIPLVNWNS